MGSSRNGDIIPPVITKFVNPRNSHSDAHSEHSDHNQEIVAYDRNRDATVVRVTYTVPVEVEEATQLARTRGKILPRRSTTPM